MTRVLLATRNPKKLVELDRILAAEDVSGIDIIGLDAVEPYPEEPETGTTFEDNALAKARDAVRATGLPTVADDSGLAVDALNGMPGVLSARWSGTRDDGANLRLVLDQLADVPDERRGASFVCAAALVLPSGVEVVATGQWSGVLVRRPRGSNGFGYDPIFVPDGDTRTSAELSPEEKDRVSHRGRALRMLVPHLTSTLT
ncbi:MAG: RdgB/HAM1 family non-canonical purine NTP pyrophosphatase [Kutzneria sp.]|nr:RdgB/HAM1 family non-canonical purine NTP pyrophosphatase [Kutzneria sp.]